jgi:hypothetical protein
MIRDDETSAKTPSITPTAPAGAKDPLPRPFALVPRRPPPGRPSTSVSLSELVERITRDVRSATEGELERRHDELRGELVGGVRVATGFSVAAIVMNVVALLAIVVVKLSSLPALPSGGVSLAVITVAGLVATAALTAMFFGAAKAGLRRPQSAR